MLIEPEVIRMLLFGLALVLMMLYRPAGILPSALRKRELESEASAMRSSADAARAAHAKGISKRFGGVHALADVDFTINHGEIYGLIGPNGAGKTSLFNVLTGIYSADGGDVHVRRLAARGTQSRTRSQRAASRARSEHPSLSRNLSALENVMIGRHVPRTRTCRRDPSRSRRRVAEEQAIETRAQELLEYVGVAKRANTLAKHLATAISAGSRSHARSQRAQASGASDEPAAGMNATEDRGAQGVARPTSAAMA
jgi:branched-chain amino acid transport system ATP-binding protein